MEVMVPLPDGSDFSFHSRNNSPDDSAPESPKRFNNYFFSAPTTPDYQHLNYDHHRGSDEKYDINRLFAFTPTPGDDLNLLPVPSADELFDGGKIRPCEPKRKKKIRSRLFFGRNNKVSSDQFTIGEENVEDSSASSSSGSSFGWLYKKWRLKHLLLSRDASHETNNKYGFLRKGKNGDLKSSSSSTTTKKNKEKATLSAHERHYQVNRAAAEEMKKRTYLPYRQNLMIGCMNLDAASVSDPSRATLKIR